MGTYRPFCYNPSPNPPISGTEQVGAIAAATSPVIIDSINEWWMGPDEDPGYIVCYVEPLGNRPNGPERVLGGEVPCHLGFKRSEEKTDASFIDLVQKMSGDPLIITTAGAEAWLASNGHWTSYGGGTSPYLLDNYPGAAAAFSMRRLSSTYNGPCLRVRRLFDNTELDIGFDVINGEDILDSPALMDFVTGPYGSWSFTGGLYVGVAGWGYVVKWYDQSGNGNDAYNFTFNQQQVIVANGGRVAQIDKDSNYLSVPYLHSFIQTPGDPFQTWSKAPLTLTTPLATTSVFTQAQVFAQNVINYLFFGASGNIGGAWYNGTFIDAKGLGFSDGTNAFSLLGEDTNPHLGYFDISTGRMLIAKDGSAVQDLGAVRSTLTVTHVAGRAFSNNLYFRGAVNELIFYNSDQSANKTGIETNINNFYNFY